MLTNLSGQVYGWNATQFSNASAITAGITAFCMTLAMIILVKKLQLDDVILTIIGNASFSLGCIIRGSIENIFGFYLSSAFIGMLAIIPIGTRSKLSKIVDERDIGKVFSLLSTCETIAPVLGSLLYTSIFSLSVHLYFGLAYHFSAVFLVIGIVSLLFVHFWRDNQVYYSE